MRPRWAAGRARPAPESAERPPVASGGARRVRRRGGPPAARARRRARLLGGVRVCRLRFLQHDGGPALFGCRRLAPLLWRRLHRCPGSRGDGILGVAIGALPLVVIALRRGANSAAGCGLLLTLPFAAVLLFLRHCAARPARTFRARRRDEPVARGAGLAWILVGLVCAWDLRGGSAGGSARDPRGATAAGGGGLVRNARNGLDGGDHVRNGALRDRSARSTHPTSPPPPTARCGPPARRPGPHTADRHGDLQRFGRHEHPAGLAGARELG